MVMKLRRRLSASLTLLCKNLEGERERDGDEIEKTPVCESNSTL